MLILLIVTTLISYLTTSAVLRYAGFLDLLERPNQRSSHINIVPHGGGVGFVVAASLVGFWLFWSEQTIWVFLLAIPLAITGLIDDVRTLSAKLRFIVQLLTLFSLLVVIGELPAIGWITGWWLSTLLLFAGIWWVNLFNFMDGTDGIATVEAISILVSAIILSKSQILDAPILLFMLVVVVAVLVFLLFNWPPAKIFMGDVGSTWLAFIVFALALLSIQAGWLSYSVWLILPALFVTDATVTLLRRIVRGEKWYQAHRTHAYQLISSRLMKVTNRTTAHRKLCFGVLAINALLLFPLALATQLYPQFELLIVIFSYLLLVTIRWVSVNNAVY